MANRYVSLSSLKDKIYDSYHKNFHHGFNESTLRQNAQASIDRILDEYELSDEVEIKVTIDGDTMIFNIIKAPDWFIERWHDLEVKNDL